MSDGLVLVVALATVAVIVYWLAVGMISLRAKLLRWRIVRTTEHLVDAQCRVAELVQLQACARRLSKELEPRSALI